MEVPVEENLPIRNRPKREGEKEEKPLHPDRHRLNQLPPKKPHRHEKRNEPSSTPCTYPSKQGNLGNLERGCSDQTDLPISLVLWKVE